MVERLLRRKTDRTFAIVPAKMGLAPHKRTNRIVGPQGGLRMRRSVSWRLAFVSFALFLVSTTLPELTAQEPQSKLNFRDNAIQVAHWLDAMAIPNPDGAGIAWKVSEQRPDPDWSLYSGSSGIVLFYLQLYRQTGDKHYLSQAEAGGTALIDAFSRADEHAPCGLWVGLAGYGYVLNELATESENDRFKQTAHRVVDRLISSAQRDQATEPTTARFSDVTDVISGNAGIGQFLLYAAENLSRKDALQLAVEVADGLLQDSIVDSVDKRDSRKWMMSPQLDREMPNYSHGTAGVANYLLNVWETLRQTPDSPDPERFLQAAQAAALYLRSIATVDNDSALIAHHFPGGERLFYLGWCHGPAGTGRFLDRIAVLEDDSSRADIDRSLVQLGVRSLLTRAYLAQRPDGLWNNVGLCCGTTGVAAYLLDHLEQSSRSADEANRIRRHIDLLNQDLMNRAERVPLNAGEAEVIGLRWPQAEHRVRPDLLEAQTGMMQGAAGIGLWLLRMDALERDQVFKYQLPLEPCRFHPMVRN